MLKKLLILLIILSMLIVFTACSENDTTGNDDLPQPPALALIPELVFAVPDSTDLVNFILEQIEFDGEMVDAYSLVQFLNFEREYVPELEYTFEIVSEDGYTPREGDNPDLSWTEFETGFLLPTESFRTYFPSDDIFTAYDVKYATDINLYRTVVVVDADGVFVTFQTGAIETEDIYHQAGNGNFYTDPGFELAEFISEHVTDSPENYEFYFTAADNETAVFSWEDIQAAYWLTTQNKAVFLNEDGTEFHDSFKKLIKIELM